MLRFVWKELKDMYKAILIDDDGLFSRVTAFGLARHEIECRSLASFEEAVSYVDGELGARRGGSAQQVQDAHAWKYPDVIILDYYLEDGNTGLSLCSRIREKSDVPIVMLSSEKSLRNTVVCLDEGADQYVYKPDNMAELVARIKASIRARANKLRRHPDEMFLDSNSRKFRVGDSSVNLTDKECKVVDMLYASLNSTVDKGSLYEFVYGRVLSVDSRCLDVLVGRVRKKLSVVSADLGIIAERNLGYRMVRPEHD
jgi:DNA-binding response OmpR family regulator